MSADPEGILWLVRHGRTDANGQRYVGWEDPPLNAAGADQAAEIAAILNQRCPAAIYSSPLRRARDTAAPLALRLALPIILEADLREIHYGAHQGRTKAELGLKLRKHHLHQRLPGGESLHDVYLRAGRFRRRIAADLAAARPIAVFGHYWSTRMVLGVLAGAEFDQLFRTGGYKPGNGSIYQIRYRTAGDRLTLVSGAFLPLPQTTDLSHEVTA
jgi:probable phosphoglycerate mutase